MPRDAATNSAKRSASSSSAVSRRATEDSRSPVGALRARVEDVRQRELVRMRRLHPEIPADTLDVLSRSLVNQLFHAPSQRLKDLDDPRLGQQFVALFEPA